MVQRGREGAPFEFRAPEIPRPDPGWAPPSLPPVTPLLDPQTMYSQVNFFLKLTRLSTPDVNLGYRLYHLPPYHRSVHNLKLTQFQIVSPGYEPSLEERVEQQLTLPRSYSLTFSPSLSNSHALSLSLLLSLALSQVGKAARGRPP